MQKDRESGEVGTVSRHPFKPRALGEVAIRTGRLAEMARFYQGVIGLEILPGNRAAHIVFFRIAEGFGGHTAILALFGEDAPQQPSALHHLALTLPYEEQEAAMAFYQTIGQDYWIEHFAWVGWRGVFTKDPDGNVVELVAYDPSEL